MPNHIKAIAEKKNQINQLIEILEQAQKNLPTVQAEFNQVASRFNENGSLKKDDPDLIKSINHYNSDKHEASLNEYEELFSNRQQGKLTDTENQRFNELQLLLYPAIPISDFYYTKEDETRSLTAQIETLQREIPALEQEVQLLLNAQLEHEQDLLNQFKDAYKKRCIEDSKGFFGFFRRSRLDLDHLNFHILINHAFKKGGDRTKDILVNELKWFDRNGNITPGSDLIEILKYEKNDLKATEITDPAAHFKGIVNPKR